MEAKRSNLADGALSRSPLLLALLLGCGGDGATDPDAPELPEASVDGASPAQVAHDAGDASSASDATSSPGSTDAGTSPAVDAGTTPRGDASTPAASDSGTPSSTDAGSGASDAATTSDASSAASCERGFCSGFEDQTGASLTGVWKSSAPNCSGDGKASIDTTTVHSGQRALRIQSGGGVCNHIFATPSFDLKPLSASLWVRLYVRFESAFKDDHVTFLAMHDEVSQKDLRMGGQKQIFMWNREKDDATLPELSPNGVSMSVAPKVGSWHCVEFHLQGDKGLLDTYVDGSLVPGLVVDGTGTHDLDGQWLNPGAFSARVTDLRLGWESYGNQAMTLWLDDVGIGDQRIGCGT